MKSLVISNKLIAGATLAVSYVALAAPAFGQSEPTVAARTSDASPEVLTVGPRAPRNAGDATTTDEVSWSPRYDVDVGVVDHVVTGTAVGVIVGAQVTSPISKHWRGGVAFDEEVRDVFRVRSRYGRYTVRDLSDVGVSLASAWPFLVDSLVTTWWHRGRADVARNMALVGAEAFAIGSAVQSVANNVASRERPYGRYCGTEIPTNSVDCAKNTRYRSFFSGHTTLAFTSAGLLCMNHLGLGLLGKAGDTATCIGGFVVASMTSMFRVMSDMHYASDVAVGTVVGTVVGLAVPWSHFRRRHVEPQAGKLELHFAPVGSGLGVVGTF